MDTHSVPLGKRFAAALVSALLVLMCMPHVQAHAVTAAEKRAEANAITEHIDSMQSSLNEMRALYEQATAEHEEAVALRDEAAAKLAEETARVEELQEKMSSFAVSMYKDDGASTFLAVLLQSASLRDFFVSWDRCEIVSNAGKSLLEEEKAARKQLDETRATYEVQATRAEQQMRIAETSMNQIEATQNDLREEVGKLTQEAERLEAEEKKAEEKEKTEEKKAGKKGEDEKTKVTDEEARKAEEDRKAKEAEIEKRAKEAADAAAAAAASAHAEANAIVLLGNGAFTNPCPTATESSGFGYRDFDNSFHKGVDMAAPEGTPYYAADSGTVLYATNDGGYNGGAGNWVVIAHGNGVVTKYMHSLSTFVKPGDQVERGQNIGLVGNTGNSFGAHLHFQVEVDGVAVNPLNYI